MRKYLIILVMLVILTLGYVWSQKNNVTKIGTEVQIGKEVEGNKEDLISFSVQPNQEVSGVLNFSGSVKNAYFFEANILINILDKNKKLLKAGNAMATTDWMTSEPVSFEGSIDLTGLPTGPGYIQIANDNASGLPEHDKFIFIPILIGQ